MLLYYDLYRNKSLLPQPGAVMDQSHFAVCVFRIFDDVMAECDKIELDRQRANQAKQSGPATPPPRGRTE